MSENTVHSASYHAALRRDDERLAFETDHVGFQIFDGELWELRNCACGTTLVIVLEEVQS